MTQPAPRPEASLPSPPAAGESSPYGGAPGAPAKPLKRIRIPHLAAMKAKGEKFAMLTAYDRYSAQTFDEAGIPLLLVGDSAGTVVYGEPNTVSVTVDELIPLTRAVVRAAPHSLVVADLPFGSYQASPQQALATAVRFFKETGAQAVKLEGGAHMAESVDLLVRSGIPVMGHVGFTPQSEHALGGYRVQGRGAGAEQLLADAQALEEAGAFAVVLEMVPSTAAAKVTQALRIPTIGIGAGPACDGQVLVWQDMMGLNTGHVPRFARRYADLAAVMSQAARQYADEVRSGAFPAPEHEFED